MPASVVRVDLSENLEPGDTATLEVEPIELECPIDAAETLMHDSDGYVWFAIGSSSESEGLLTWTATRLSSELDSGDETRELGELPVGESPQLFWIAADQGITSNDHLLFTENGVVQIPRNELPFDQPGPFRLLVAENDPPGDWQRLFPTNENRRFRTAFRSPSLSFFDSPDSGCLFLADLQSTQPTAGRRVLPSDAYSFDVDKPVKSMRPIQGNSETMPVVAWLPPTVDRPELSFWRGESADESVIEMRKRGADGTVDSARLELPEMRTIEAAINVTSPSGELTSAIDFAASDGSLIAMHRLPAQDTWSRIWIPAAPTELEIIDSIQGVKKYRIQDARLPSQLPHTAHSLRVKIASAYWRWWHTDYSNVTVSVGNIKSPIGGRWSCSTGFETRNQE